MIITSLQGGLGNQMFQYAAGYALSKRLKTELIVDASWFNNQHKDTHRDFELDVFGIYPNRLPWWWNCGLIKNKIFTTIKEPSNFSFRDTLFQINKRNVILFGYWQSEKYFMDYESEIRKQFSFPKPLDNSVKKYIAQIQRVEAVSVHIRRGDYAHNAKTKAFHGLLPLSYYKKAMLYISSRVKKPVFYVFSDDLDWAKKNLKSNYPLLFVSHNGPSYEDMRLMSLCKHHIIANSSFSWWGAWLNPNKKIVVAPQRWFCSSSRSIEGRIPKEWITL